MDQKYSDQYCDPNKKVLFSQASRRRTITVISDWRPICMKELQTLISKYEKDMWVEPRRKRPIGVLEDS